MLWNMYASLDSHVRGQPSSTHVSSFKLNSASPLVRRRYPLLGDLDKFYRMLRMTGCWYMEEKIVWLRVNLKASVVHKAEASILAIGGMGGEEEYEIFGPAANVESQAAGSSQWIRSALDRESENFLESVQNTISENQTDKLS